MRFCGFCLGVKKIICESQILLKSYILKCKGTKWQATSSVFTVSFFSAQYFSQSFSLSFTQDRIFRVSFINILGFAFFFFSPRPNVHIPTQQYHFPVSNLLTGTRQTLCFVQCREVMWKLAVFTEEAGPSGTFSSVPFTPNPGFHGDISRQCLLSV